MDLEKLETTSQVIDALGGNVPVAELTDSKPNAVSNWRGFETFPPNTYVVLTHALAQIGKTAPTKLWRMKLPAEQESAA
jgi:hypothetical protein